jgi:hypothetical protein
LVSNRPWNDFPFLADIAGAGVAHEQVGATRVELHLSKRYDLSDLCRFQFLGRSMTSKAAIAESLPLVAPVVQVSIRSP